MAKPSKSRAPKVYWAEIDGLNDWIVAAPNRPRALAALDVRQDLFGQGLAGDETDPGKIAQAQARPGVPLRRPKGSSEPFSEQAAAATDWSAAVPKAAKPKAGAKKKPDRKALDQAEARLVRLEDEHRLALEDIESDRARLDERAAREAEHYAAAKAEAEAHRDRAAEAFKATGA